jgi:hypothetical protein
MVKSDKKANTKYAAKFLQPFCYASEMLNKEQNVQECDATTDASSTSAWPINNNPANYHLAGLLINHISTVTSNRDFV